MDPKHLGKQSALPASPEEAALDYVPNPKPGELYLVRFAAPEFTSLCPITGQPDFAHLVIDYAPAEQSGNAQSMGGKPRCSRKAFALEKWRQPKKPLCALSGEGCGAFSTRCRDVSTNSAFFWA